MEPIRTIATRPQLTGRSIGSMPNPEQRAPWIDFQATKRVFGRAEGYASFEQALIGTMHATLGERNPAAAIFRLDGRFYAQGIDRFVTTNEHPREDTVRHARLRFEDAGMSIADVEPADASVVALVDGTSSLIFGDPTRP